MIFVYFAGTAAGPGTLTPLAPITLQEMKLDPTMAAYQQGKPSVNGMRENISLVDDGLTNWDTLPFIMSF